MSAQIFVVSAPSGCGKTTVIDALSHQCPTVHRAITTTTRPPRPGEVHGKDYFFLSKDAFQKGLEKNAFVEHTRRYDHFYGVSRSSIDAVLAQGHNLILNIDWVGLASIRTLYPGASTSIFLLPPSLQALKDRLTHRNSDDAATIQQRMRCAQDDTLHWTHYDHIVINDILVNTVNTVVSIINGTPYTTDRTHIDRFVTQLQGQTFS